MEIIWKKIEQQYGSPGYDGDIGKWTCFEISYNGTRSKSEVSASTDYKLICHLPGIKDHLGAFDLDGAKAKAAKFFEYWHKNLCA